MVVKIRIVCVQGRLCKSTANRDVMGLKCMSVPFTC